MTNAADTLLDTRVNLLVPKLDGSKVQRIDEHGSEVVTGTSHEVGGHLAQGVEGALRWVERDLVLPGGGTTEGLMFDIGTVAEPTPIQFGLNADELGEWIWKSAVIHPHEEDDRAALAAEWDPLDDDDDED